MKKIVYILSALSIALLYSCGGGSGETVAEAPVVEEAPVAEEAPAAEADAPASANHPEGLNIYKMNCTSCHQENGKGIPSSFPPLAASDFLANKEAVIKQVLNGSTGEMVVNGVTYNGAMNPFNSLTDQEIADVLNFVYNSWGNTPANGDVTPEEVAALR